MSPRSVAPPGRGPLHNPLHTTCAHKTGRGVNSQIYQISEQSASRDISRRARQMRMHTIGERQVQIPGTLPSKSLEEKSKSGSVYNRRFLRAGSADFSPRGAHAPQCQCVQQTRGSPPPARLRSSQVLKRGVVASHGCRDTTDDSTPTARAASVVVNHPDTARRWDLRGSTPESPSVTPTVVPSAGGALSCWSSCW